MLLDEARFGGVGLVEADEIVCSVEIVQIDVVFPLADCVGSGDVLSVAELGSPEEVEELPLSDSEVGRVSTTAEGDEPLALVADEDDASFDIIDVSTVGSQLGPSHSKLTDATPVAMASM